MSEVFWADGRSDEFKEGYALGYHDGSKDDTSPILTDLIAELRAWSDSELLNPDTELHVNRMADRAEARLKGLNDE